MALFCVPYIGLFFGIFGLPLWLPAWLFYRIARRSRVEICADRIRKQGPFAAQELPFSEIKGYVMRRMRYGNKLFSLIPQSKPYKGMHLNLDIENPLGLQEWITHTFTELDPHELK